MLTTLILLNLAGGDCVEDLEKLEGDEGFALMLHRVETYGMPRAERRQLERRWRKSTQRRLPSVSAMRRFLSSFHDPFEEAKREQGVAMIPKAKPALEGLHQVLQTLLGFIQSHSPQGVATLDMDATLIETGKREALFCYKGFRAYQPLNVWWAEQELVVRSEFRDGNVPAGYGQLRLLEESLASLPEGVEEVRMRSDTAGYQWDLLRHCAEGKDERFGVIDFAVGVAVSPEFRQAVQEVEPGDWKPLYHRVGARLVETGQEWAEVCYVPAAAAVKKNGPSYRFLATREPVRQLELEGMSSDSSKLPFPTLEYPEQPCCYKIYGVVTNLDWAGDEVIWWYRERCGKSEEAHAVMKKDLAGGQLPSKLFGANAAWWGVMLVALNLHAVMKRLVLGKEWVSKRMKSTRYWLINVPGRLVQHARRLILKLSGGHPSTQLLLEARRRLAELANAAPG